MKKLYSRINEFWLRSKKWSNESILGYITGAVTKLIFIIAFVVLIYFVTESIWPSKEDSFVSNSNSSINENCSVAGITIHGTIMTYIPNHTQDDITLDDATASENVVWSIKNANEDENIKAILLEVDSIGGYPTAADEISNAVKSSDKIVIGLIREKGLSAAYWAVSGSDKIFASQNSDVGSIGITSSFLDNVQKNEKDGYTYQSLSVGKYKDSGSPDKTLTQDEKDLFMRDLNIIYNNFVEEVSVNRNIPIDKVKELANGSSVLGEIALKLGLIDAIGGIDEAENYIEEVIGEKPEICWE